MKKSDRNEFAPENLTHPRLKLDVKYLPRWFVCLTVFPYILSPFSMEDTLECMVKRNMGFFWQITQHGRFRFYLSFTLFHVGGLVRWKSCKAAFEKNPFVVEAEKNMYEPLTSHEILQLCRDEIGSSWCNNIGKGLKVVEGGEE